MLREDINLAVMAGRQDGQSGRASQPPDDPELAAIYLLNYREARATRADLVAADAALAQALAIAKSLADSPTEAQDLAHLLGKDDA